MVQPHRYQQDVLQFLMQRLYVDGQRGAGVFLDPGLGKTLISLLLIERLKALGEVQRTLIVAPLRVCYSVWPQEIEKWGLDLTCRIAHGNMHDRVAALESDADVVLLNREAVPLVYARHPELLKGDLLIVDESTSFKSWSALRSKALRKVVSQFSLRVILTGTPAPNSSADLHAQVWLLDNGESLGRTVTAFRQQYQFQGGFQNHEWLLRPGADEKIATAIAPLCFRLRAGDFLNLPERVDNMIWLELPPDLRKRYKTLEDELFLELEKQQDVVATSAGSAYMLCRQFCNGGVYRYEDDDTRIAEHVHGLKVDALVDLVDELGGKPVLVCYQFTHDVARIWDRLGRVPVISGDTSGREGALLIEQWNDGRLPVLLVQPQSLSHGVNLQHGGNDLVWFGLSDQLELYIQMVARLHRQGVQGHVRIHHLLLDRTVERAIWRRLCRKDASQTALLEEIRRWRDERDG